MARGRRRGSIERKRASGEYRLGLSLFFLPARDRRRGLCVWLLMLWLLCVLLLCECVCCFCFRGVLCVKGWAEREEQNKRRLEGREKKNVETVFSPNKKPLRPTSNHRKPIGTQTNKNKQTNKEQIKPCSARQRQDDHHHTAGQSDHHNHRPARVQRYAHHLARAGPRDQPTRPCAPSTLTSSRSNKKAQRTCDWAS